jgi:proline racemase
LVASFSVIDTHTAGHPTRVILSGVPPLKGDSVRARREDFRSRFDHLRPALLHEPRGHAAMVGLVPVPSAVADYGAFFISSYVYLDMCGHGTIGFARTLAHSGEILPATGDSFTLETPAGVVTVGLAWSADGSLDRVRIRNVPSYVGLEGVEVDVPPFGPVGADIVYGGMWYALIDADRLGLDLVPDNASRLLRAGAEIKEKLKQAVKGNPLFEGSPAPSVLFFREKAPDAAVHFLVLDSNKFDRSPCGTGTAARMTHLLKTGRLEPTATYRAENILGIPFEARLAEEAMAGERPAAVIEISGNAYITAAQTIFFEANDPLTAGFLCR